MAISIQAESEGEPNITYTHQSFMFHSPEELCLGKILPASKKRFLDIMDKLAKNRAQGVILGCTEIGLLVQQKDTEISLFDTAAIHAESAALKSIEK